MEKLTGKLRWEKTANGIRVEIPGWMGWWQTLFLIPWLGFWTYGGWDAMKNFAQTGSLFLLLWLCGWVAGEVFASGFLLWSLFGRVVVTLDPGNLNLVHRLGGFDFRSRSFPTVDVRNLRYRPLGRGRSQRLSVMCFESGDKTYNFGSGISDIEAFALIDKMLEVYSFPKERAMEYLDLSR